MCQGNPSHHRFFERLQQADDWFADGLEPTVGGVVAITATYDQECMRCRFTFAPDAERQYRPTSLEALPNKSFLPSPLSSREGKI